MRKLIVILICLMAAVSYGQQLGMVHSGGNSLRICKDAYSYEFVYTDINAIGEKSFYFADKNEMYSMIMNGFMHKKDHQIVILSAEDTIVKFYFKKVKGVVMFYVHQNNLSDQSTGRSSFFKKEDIESLFARP